MYRCFEKLSIIYKYTFSTLFGSFTYMINWCANMWDIFLEIYSVATSSKHYN